MGQHEQYNVRQAGACLEGTSCCHHWQAAWAGCNSQGTNSSKKKKAHKLKRVMQAVKKAERRQAGSVSESFAAMQLLHDPQVRSKAACVHRRGLTAVLLPLHDHNRPHAKETLPLWPPSTAATCEHRRPIAIADITSFVLQTFAERLFARLQKANERLETRLAMMAVISRAVGVHKLLLLNFYPFLQKYIQPHQRDVTNILAILIQVSVNIVGFAELSLVGFTMSVGTALHPQHEVSHCSMLSRDLCLCILSKIAGGARAGAAGRAGAGAEAAGGPVHQRPHAPRGHGRRHARRA